MFKIKIGKIKKINEELYFYGWIEDKRELGKIIFLTIKDFSGEIQVVVKKQDQKDLWEISERIPRQSIIRVDGKSVDNKGKIEIVPSSITLINEAIHPLPLDPSGRVKANIYTCANYKVVSKLKRLLWKKSKDIVTIEEIQESINNNYPLNLQVHS